MHNPSTSGPDPFRHEAGIVNAYDDRYTTQIAYYSDSCGLWRPEAVTAFRCGTLSPRVQVLVHPIFWGATRQDRFQRLDRFIEGQIDGLRRSAEASRESWRRHAAAQSAERAATAGAAE
jgi:hypothetical protein